MFSHKFDEKYFERSLRKARTLLLQILANLLNAWAIFFVNHSRYFEHQCLCFHQEFVTALQSLFQSLLLVV